MTNDIATMLDWALVKFPPSRRGTNKVKTLVAYDFLVIADIKPLSSKMAGRSSRYDVPNTLFVIPRAKRSKDIAPKNRLVIIIS
jgi:hypothetical protein